MSESIWLAIGFTGQILFGSRFIIQWLASEKAKKSVMPLAFWFFSIGGGLTLLSYAIWRRDPVFIVGQSLGIFIYGRNLMLIRREKQRKSAL
ncbi:Lipid-A-disaccharide synthase [hydrothermal vent metagenome]|uniref:Lipid-A-disaccharide synthase n=1 Tax=hydrothermal vent metagenome TaxID=652676 RepID=A0A3B0V6S6_9ZZZZ